MKMNLRHTIAVVFLVVICAAALSGCDLDYPPAVDMNDLTPTVKPDHDAFFAFVRSEQNKDGVRTGPVKPRTERVVDTGLALDGFFGVYAVYDEKDTFFYYYDPTGNPAIHLSRNILRHISSELGALPLQLKWFTLPIQDRGRRRDTLTKLASYNDGSSLVPLTVATESQYQGRSTLFVDGVSLVTHQVATTITIDIGATRHSILAIHVFAPRIGFFTAFDIRANLAPSAKGVLSNGYLKQITRFDL